MGRPDFDPSASDDHDADEAVETSMSNAYFGADTPNSSVGSVAHGDDSNVSHVFGTRTENEDGTS